MYRAKASLVLASGSPRRRELLSRMGLDYKIVASGVEEDGSVEAGPDIYCQEWAARKADAVADVLGREEDHWYLAVDTIVVIEDKIYEKPKDEDEAGEFLRALSDKWHKVLSGYCIFHPKSGTRISNVVISEVKIKKLSEDEIEGYIRTGEPFDKAGGYAVQGVGAFMVEQIRGSYTNVVGIPLTEIVNDLLRVDVIEVDKEVV